MKRHRARRLLIGSTSGALLLAGWVLLAPSQLGGGVSYLTTAGSSMEPRYHEGDLVLVRATSSYELGDVAAYKSDVIGTTVMHRIVEREADHFVLQGDNNDFLDPDRPRTADFIGKEWVRVAGGGRFLAFIGKPVNAAAMGAVGLFVVAAITRLRGKRRRRGGRAAAPRHAAPRAWAQHLEPARIADAARPVLAIVAVGVVALSTLAFTRSTTASGTVDYRHTGRFAYEAPAASGPAYGARGVRTGDTVFLQLVQSVDVTFDYALSSPAATDVTGTAVLEAEVRNANGWHQSIELAPVETFSGSAVRLRAKLDLVRTRALIDEVEASTGVAGGTYTIALAPTIDVDGTIGGLPASGRFAPRAEFLFDRLQLRPSGVVDADGAVSSAFAPTEALSLDAPNAERTHLDILGHQLAVDLARQLALIVGAVAALATAFSFWVTRRSTSTSEAAFVARHQHRLVIVRDYRPGGDRTDVDVTAISTIGTIAEQHDRPIVVVDDAASGRASYLVEVDRTVYRYRLPAPAAGANRPFVVLNLPSRETAAS